jgi:DNA polymerase-3 subunit delta'
VQLGADLPWLAQTKAQLQMSLAADQCPHALLIHGQQGLGKRQLALWLAGEFLGPAFRGAAEAAGDEAIFYADFLHLKPPEGKFVIPVNAVRDQLIPFLSLTSHGSGGRVALLDPASALNHQAASSLLKVLEEPPPGCLIILLTERPGQLLPTVRSRCQLAALTAPPLAEGAAWLAEQVPGKDFSRLLDFCGGAPLEALALHESDEAGFATDFMTAVAALERRTLSPMAAAQVGAKRAPMALDLLEWRVAGRIRDSFTAAAAADAGVAAMRQAGFAQLDQIRELRPIISGGINAELSLAGLLLDWYGGLGHPEARTNG